MSIVYSNRFFTYYNGPDVPARYEVLEWLLRLLLSQFPNEVLKIDPVRSFY